MSLLYFDGFETYGVIPTSSSATGVNATTSLTAAGWSGTNVAAATTNIARPGTAVDPDSRSWISSLSAATNAGWTTPRKMSQFNLTTTGTSLVVGYKISIPTQYSGGLTSIGRVFFDAYIADIMVQAVSNGNIQIVSGSAPTSLTATLTLS